MRMKNKTQTITSERNPSVCVLLWKDSFQQQAAGPPGGTTGQLPTEDRTTAHLGVSGAQMLCPLQKHFSGNIL